MKKLSYRIKKLRESKDLKPGHIAGELGISYSAYSKIERGITDPSVSRLEQIAKILNVPVTYFFTGDNEHTIAEESKQSYGYASKNDIDRINFLIKEMAQELQALKKKMDVFTVAQKKKR